MKDRLIELISEAKDIYPAMPLVNGCKPEFKYFLADYLLANGVIVPPCKVGDWVWYISDEKVNKAKIEELHYQASKHGYFSDSWLFHSYDFKKKEEVSFWRDDFGKTVFLSRKEAEKALAERRATDEKAD